MSSTSTRFPDPWRSQRPWGVPPRFAVPPVRDSSTTPPIQLVSELDEVRAHYPPDRRNPMDLDFICHNSMKYRCCFCEERILVHESELVLDRFFEKHRCPPARRSAESSTPPASPIGDNLPTSHDQYSCRDYTQGCTYMRSPLLLGNSTLTRIGRVDTGMHGGSYVWNIKVSPLPLVEVKPGGLMRCATRTPVNKRRPVYRT
ncbi:hypothetical protein FA13DRAFT_1731049 [Coprinellus micaceus]|uniref:Uncharacterized protein n=1 Tax=Coprinellus micaceus TaxID=71717 RepID=A0A4Y7TIF4_COPMI|nr:hypothetical protein FA13DRAFT_1731049 [Coprinellus micaceus]